MRRRGVRPYIIAGLFLLIILFICWGAGFLSRTSPKSLIQEQIIKTRDKVLLIGIDAQDWKILNQLMEQGELPTFSRLKENGASGILTSQKPLLSPLIWTTFATGRPPDEHGVLDFFYVDPQTQTVLPASSQERKVKAIWNIFSDFGKSVAVIGWFATWPAEPVKGYMVSDQLSYYLFKKSNPATSSGKFKIYPESLNKKIRPFITTADDISYEEISKFVHIGEERYNALHKEEQEHPSEENDKKDPVKQLKDALATTKTYARIASWIIKEDQPDFLAIYFEGIDTACHLFMKYAPPRLSYVPQFEYDLYKDGVFQFYRYMDTVVGELIAGASKDTTIIIVSDHGFFSGGDRLNSDPSDLYGKGALWHREQGVILACGNNVRKASIEGANIFNITPTVLYLSGFPLSKEMKGQPILPAITDEFKKTHPIRVINTYEKVNPISARKPLRLDFSNRQNQELKEKLKALGYIGPGASDTLEGTKLTNINNLGLVYFARKDYEKAENEFVKALNIRPGFIDALQNLALVYLDQKKYSLALETAIKIFSSAMPNSTDDYDFLIRIGEEVHNWDQMEELLLNALDSHPGKVEPLIALAKVYQYLKRDEKAVLMCRKALSVDPKAEIPLIQVLDYLLPKGREKEAELLLKTAISHDPQNAFLHTKLGRLFLQEHDFLLAQQEFEEAQRLNADPFEPLFYLGICYGSLGDIDKAISTFEKVLSYYPDNYDALLNLAASYAKKEQFEKALPLFEKAYQKGPKTPELLNPFGALYMQMGQANLAIKVFEESLQLFPGQPDATLVKNLLSELRGARKN